MCDLPALVLRLVAIFKLWIVYFLFCFCLCVWGGGVQDSIDRCPAPMDMSHGPLATVTVYILFVCFLIWKHATCGNNNPWGCLCKHNPTPIKIKTTAKTTPQWTPPCWACLHPTVSLYMMLWSHLFCTDALLVFACTKIVPFSMKMAYCSPFLH